MHVSLKSVGWLVASSIVLWLAASLHASEPWASPQALGDVVISFDEVMRVYGQDNGVQKGSDIPVAGFNRGIAFDGSLQLFVTNTNGTSNRVVVLDPGTPHGQTGTPVATQPNPHSIVFAGDGSFYVASRSGATATIERFSAAGVLTNTYSVAVSTSGTCVGIDLDATQTKLFIVDGAVHPQARLVRTLDVVTSAQGSLANAILDTQGIACGIRAVPPARHSGATNGGFLIADKVNIKRLSSSGLQVGLSFTTGTSSASDNNWIDVDLDPNTFDFWGLDAGEMRAARFRLESPPGALQSISNLPGIPRGLTLNGALRGAQTMRLLTVAPNTVTGTTFLTGTSYEQEFDIKLPVAGTVAVQAVEGRSDGAPDAVADGNDICPASLDVDCRITEVFTDAVARSYSRGRAAFYVATELTVVGDVPTQIRVQFPAAAITNGAACVPNGPTQPALALLRDPYPHTNASSPLGFSIFTDDITVLVYSESGGTVGRTLNHYIVADRTDTLYNAHMVKPAFDSDQQIGSTMQVAVEIRNPDTACSPVSGLETTIAIAVSNVTTGQLVVDSEGLSNNVLANGIQFVNLNGQYRANVYLDPALFTANNEYRVCVNAKATQNVRAIGDVCQDFNVVAGKGKTK